MEPKTDNDWEMAEDTCEFVLDDGTVCGAHIGYGVRWLHLGRCDDHPDEDDAPAGDGKADQ